METKALITEFRRNLCRFNGYDENLKYVGDKSRGSPKDDKAFLAPRDFLDFAIQDSAILEDERNRVTASAIVREPGAPFLARILREKWGF